MTRKMLKKPNICLIDYYLDGHYHHWEEIQGKDFPMVGHRKMIPCQEQEQKEVVVTSINAISEDEFHVMLSSQIG